MLGGLKRALGKNLLCLKLKGLSYDRKLLWVLFRCRPEDIRQDVILTDFDLTTRYVLTYAKKVKKRGKAYNAIAFGMHCTILESGIGYPSALLIADVLRIFGVKRILRIGLSGYLNKDLASGEFFLPDTIANADTKLLKPARLDNKSIRAWLIANNVRYHSGNLASSPLLVKCREYLPKGKKRIDCVDMECFWLWNYCSKNCLAFECLMITGDYIPAVPDEYE